MPARAGCVRARRPRSRSPAARSAAAGTRASGECSRGRRPAIGPRGCAPGDREGAAKGRGRSISARTIARYRIDPPPRAITRAAMLTIADLTYRIAGRTLLDGASAQINAGWKVGLVGRNGAGKSTLLDLIRGERQADGGELKLQKGVPLRFLSHEAPPGAPT